MSSAIERVAVVIPTYNRGHLLPRAIDSVLSQTRSHLFDLIVIDDGSTDDTVAIVAGYGDRIRLIRQDNRGAAAARNAGVRAARSDLVAFLDSDDWWLPGKMERQLAAFARWPALVLVAGRALAQHVDGTQTLQTLPAVPLDVPTDLAPALFEANLMQTPTVIVRRAALLTAGGFDERLRRCNDYPTWVRIACCGPGLFMGTPVAVFDVDTPASLQKDREAALAANLVARRKLRACLAQRPDCRAAWRHGIVRHLVSMRDRAYADERFAEAAWRGLESFRYQPWSRPRWEWWRLLSSLFRAAGRRRAAHAESL